MAKARRSRATCGASPSRRAGLERVRTIKEFCRSLPGATEDVKWGDDHVFGVGGKMFAAFDVEASDSLGFKCDDDDFERLTGIGGIFPAPYAARFGWVLVTRADALTLAELRALLARSHALVLSKLPRRVRESIAGGG